MDGWMDGWRRCVATTCARCRASRNRLHSTSLVEGNLKVFEAILGGFWRPKWTPNQVFRRFFRDAFFDRVLASVLRGFLEARNLKNHCFLLEKSMIFIKSTLSKKYRKIVNLGFGFGRQNMENSIKQGIENHIFFRI